MQSHTRLCPGEGCARLRLNEHIEAEGPTVFAHACKIGLEGIVSKRKGSPYRSGRSHDWLKMKNPTAPAVNGKPRRIGGGGSDTFPLIPLDGSPHYLKRSDS
jgi:hypothetical protein